MTAVVLDRNRTVWQRIQDRCEPVFGREVADQIASLLLPYVAAERAASHRAGALVPVHVFGKVGVVGGDDRGGAYVAPLDEREAPVVAAELQSAFGRSHNSSPSVAVGTPTVAGMPGGAMPQKDHPPGL